MKKESEISKILAALLVVLIICSIALTYQVLIIDKDYEIFTNPDGPDTSDYFEEE